MIKSVSRFSQENSISEAMVERFPPTFNTVHISLNIYVHK